ncbi:MAG: CsgG/HfaB family protein [Pseudomonadota bacterium]
MKKAIIAAVVFPMLLAGCEENSYAAAFEPDGMVPTTGMMTTQNRALRAIPAPAHRVTVSVYGLPDLTGQYKEDDTGQTLSRAVTQGGAAVLIKALRDAGERRWFTILDRSNLENVIRERQIITEMRRIYRNEQNINPGVLGPLAHSGILVEGAIVGYDTNTVTGGAGARYLGIGGDTRYKLDTVTVSLRAVSTETSEVLAAVTVRKPLASVSKRGSIFTYVALDELLETEVGQTFNEPKQVAIEQAVEKAVMALIAEGAQVGLWSFASAEEGSNFIDGFNNQTFDGDVPARARNQPATATGNTAIPRTVPVTPRASTPEPAVSQLPRARRPAPPPNTPDSDEIVG